MAVALVSFKGRGFKIAPTMQFREFAFDASKECRVALYGRRIRAKIDAARHCYFWSRGGESANWTVHWLAEKTSLNLSGDLMKSGLLFHALGLLLAIFELTCSSI